MAVDNMGKVLPLLFNGATNDTGPPPTAFGSMTEGIQMATNGTTATPGLKINEDFIRQIVSSYILSRHLIPSLVYVCLMFIIGVPGNLLVCYIYYQKWLKRKKTSTLFIMALSWFDLANNLVSLPIEVAMLTHFVSFDHPSICKISRFCTFFLNAASSILLIGIAVDRFIGIWCSFRTKPFGIERAKKIIMLACVLALLTCWPALLLYGTQTIPDPRTGVDLKTCLIDDNFMHGDRKKYTFIYGVYLLTSNIVCDAIFITLYSLIGCKVFRRRRFGNYSQRHRKRQSSFISFRRKPSLYSYSSSMGEEELTSCSSFRSGRKSFTTKLLRKESFTSVDDNETGSLMTIKDSIFQRSFKSRKKLYPSTTSVPEEEIQKLPVIDETNSVFEREKPLRSLSLPNCNVICKNDSEKLSKTLQIRKKWNFRSSRNMSISSQCSLSEKNIISSDNFMGRYGRTYHTGKTTLMLFLVTLAYMLTFVPYCVIVIVRYTDENFYNTRNDVEKNIYQLFLRSYFLSSAVNPIIYSFLNKTFRQDSKAVIKNLFCLVTKKKWLCST